MNWLGGAMQNDYVLKRLLNEVETVAPRIMDIACSHLVMAKVIQ